MTESQINAYIDTLHFNTFKKVASKVKQHFPGITDAEIRNIIKKRIHDKRISKDNKKIYQVKVFSKFPNAWMCDIFDNLANNEPRYWYIFININTRFAEAYPMRNKTKDCINTVLRLFVNKYHPRKITSDEEAGLVSALNVDFLKDNKCGLYIIQEKKHSALSLIDRFIRTLRDMNKPTNEGQEVSTDDEFKYIDRNKMTLLLSLYNNSVHASTGHTPSDMMNNKQLEEDYIEKCLNGKQRQQGIQDFKLTNGSLVRYYIDYNKNDKRRYNISREAYKIESRAGNIYTIIALDGTTKDVPRWRLIEVQPNEKYTLGKTLGTDKGIVERIVRASGPNTVDVKFKMPDGSDYIKTIHRRELRFPTPQFESQLERDFLNDNQ